MHISSSSWLLLLACIVSNVAAQTLLKYGIQRLGHFDFVGSQALPIFFKSLQNWHILGGLACYFTSFLTWFLTLARMDVSFAYPMTSLGYLLTLVIGYFWLQESISLLRVIGVVVIIVGVCLVARS